jgi:hypothetical protein
MERRARPNSPKAKTDDALSPSAPMPDRNMPVSRLPPEHEAGYEAGQGRICGCNQCASKSLPKPVEAQAISRFSFQGHSALLRGDLDGPVKFSFCLVALTD